MIVRTLIAALAFLAVSPPVPAQPDDARASATAASNALPAASRTEWGIPFPSKHYAPQEYGQDPQNWAIAQDDRGLIYVANSDGLLEYDGERWRLIPTRTGTIVRSLATDSLVYVGAKGDFGVLRPDSNGVLRYSSLYDHVPDNARDFNDIWSTHTLNGHTYFQSNQYLFRWDGSTIQTWSSRGGFHTSFTSKGTFYIRDRERGLLRMEGDSLRLTADGDLFSDASIRMMAPHPSGAILIATEKQGLYLLGEDGARPLRLPDRSTLRPFLREHDLYHGCALPGNRYALATLGGGVAVIDAQGRILRLLDESTGLPDEVVNYVLAGREGELWMALNNDGIYRSSLTTSTTLFDERNGLKGMMRTLERHDGRLYAATGRGLHLLRGGGSSVDAEPARFDRQPGLPLVWDLTSVGDELLAATERGVYLAGTNRKITNRQTYIFSPSPDSQTVYAGTRMGISRLRRRDGEWRSSPVGETQTEIRSLTLGPDGNLWAGTFDDRILYLALSPDGSEVASQQTFVQEAGLPAGYKSPAVVDQHLAVLSSEGLFHLDNPDAAPSSWQFSASPLLPEDGGADTLAVKAFLNNRNGQLWAALGNRLYRGHRGADGQYAWTEIEALRFPKSEGIHLFAEQDSILWLGTGKRLIRYAPSREDGAHSPAAPFEALVRQVTTRPLGTVVYGGAPPNGQSVPSITLPYSSNTLRVDVAGTLMDRVTPPQYQYKLVGHRDRWTDWTGTPHVTFSNLWEGTYTFRVRAQSETGRRSQVGRLTLSIQPPWYRSLWAYLLYGVAAVGLLFGFRHYYRINQERKQAQKQALKLEKEREVRQQLERANKRLREANQLKEDFLANTSHELRTPLTNILGFVDVLRDSATEDQQRFLSAIEKNSRRLERTLNALLDLSKLRSGSEDLELEPTALGDRVRRLAPEFRDAAEEKGLSFEVNVPDEPVYADADERYLDQILSNLIENAIKFTEEGRVAVSIETTEDWATVEVEDTGIGIDQEFLPKLFRDFEQESRGRSRTHEGYGLGLAISSRLAKRMGGHIEVESTKGEGSTFTLFLTASAEVRRDVPSDA